MTAEHDGSPGTATGVWFGVLGPFEIRRTGQRVDPPPRRLRWLLATLLLREGELVSEDHLASFVWGADGASLGALRTAVSRLRSWLHGLDCTVEHDNGAYRIVVSSCIVDASLFRKHLAQPVSDRNNGAALDNLREALALWRDAVLTGAPDWVRAHPEVARLEASRLDCAQRLGTLAVTLGQPEVAVEPLTTLAGLHPFHEPLHAVYLRVLSAAGRPASALEQYEQLRRRLSEGLGVDPSDEVQRVHLAVLHRDQRLDTPIHQGNVPAQLPPDVRGFAGRGDVLAKLDAIAAETADHATAVPIVAVAGTPGVGKTALAIHWAHRVAVRFPHGQLFINLRGFDPNGTAMRPAEALRRILAALDIPTQRIPTDLAAQVDLYRSLTTGRRMLMVLDNARDADQIRPLLPGSPTCFVIVTSRNLLSSLVAIEGAHLLPLDLLSAADSRQLLTLRISSAQVQMDSTAVDEIIARCAGLPLALAIIAGRAAARPAFAIDAIAAEIRAAEDGLQVFAGDDMTSDLQAVLSWSYHALSTDTASIFRLLGLHQGPDFTAQAIASLTGISAQSTSAPLAELARAHLITEHTPGRYGMHDLLHAYATKLAYKHDPDDERRAAVRRLLDHYLHAAHAAAMLLDQHREAITLTPPQPGVAHEVLVDHAQAIRWFRAEHPVLEAAVELAVVTGNDKHVWQLAWALGDFQDRHGYWHDRVATEEAGLAAAQRLADLQAQTYAHRSLAVAYAKVGRFGDARPHYVGAIALYREQGDRVGQARIHHSLSVVAEQQGRLRDALAHAEQALHLFESAGHEARMARTLNVIGWYHTRRGNHRRALRTCRRALALLDKIDDRFGQALTWDSLGHAYHGLGDHRRATACYQRALDLYREAGGGHRIGETLVRLGDTHHTIGNLEAATQAWRAALLILDEGRHPGTDHVRARLTQVESAIAKSGADGS